MSRSARGLFAHALLPALLLGSGAALAGGIETPNVDRQLGPYVRNQVLLAAERLGEAACAQVLSDYEDPRTGRPLAESLPRERESAAAYVAALIYRPGPADGPCKSPLVSAYTSPGSSVIFVCGGRFRRWEASRDRSGPVNVLIHEALHTLGLGENPPTSGEITERVASRCGR